MRELPENDPRVLHTYAELTAKLGQYIGKAMGQSALDGMDDVIAYYRAQFKREHGYEFPQLVLFVLPSIQFVAVYRRDLSSEEIRLKLHHLLRQLSNIRRMPAAIEIAAAVRRAWPRYNPDVIDSLRKDPKIERIIQ